MKKVKIITIILAIVLVSLVAFGGVYIQTQNRMEDKVKEYSLGRELKGERVVEIKVTDGSTEGKTKPSDEELTVENYETVKKTVENRLKDLGAQDYTISLDKENGTIRVELPEDSNTDTYVYYLTASGKVEMKEKDTENVLLNDSMIKKAQYTYTSNADGAYQVYLELILTKDGQAKLDEVKNDYAVLATEVSEAESKNNTTSDNTTTESSTDENNTTTNTTTEGTETQKSEETKKIASLTIAGTSYDIEKYEKNKITVKIGSQTSNTTTVNNSIAKAAELSMLINAGKYPIDYEVDVNRYVESDIEQQQLIYFIAGVAVILVIIFIIATIKYKGKGLLASISFIGFIALTSLLLRYTNVIISIEGIGAILLTIIINLKLNQMILNKTKTMDVVSEATKASYKELFTSIIPIIIITIVFCFSGWTSLSSFGMIMFWGLVLIAVYNIVVTKTLLKLKESK